MIKVKNLDGVEINVEPVTVTGVERSPGGNCVLEIGSGAIKLELGESPELVVKRLNKSLRFGPKFKIPKRQDGAPAADEGPDSENEEGGAPNSIEN